MIPLKQDKDYNCATYSLHFLLGLYGIESSLKELEEIIGTTEQDGTSHEGIKNGLSHFNFKWVSYDGSDISMLKDSLPAIINYQHLEDGKYDGHYCVVLGTGNNFFIIYNPSTGEIESIEFDYLDKNWYSERYGKGWLIKPSKIIQ